MATSRTKAPERTTAAEQLERFLYVVAAASGKAARSLKELAEALGVEPSQVTRDIEEVMAREDYLPAGTVDAFQITNDGRRVHIWTTGQFRRPVRLSPLEALALGLGFRVLAAGAAGSPERREELLAFARRLERDVASSPPEELLERFAVDDGTPGDGSVRAVLRRAAAERRRCRIAYLSSGRTRPDERVVFPYVLGYANGAWYAIAHCTKRDEVRLFRLDRIVTAELVDGTFDVPPDFDPGAYIAGGRLYRADEEIEAVVRYSPRIARWVRERGPVEELEDGSMQVRLRVADVHWLVRHWLEHVANVRIHATTRERPIDRLTREGLVPIASLRPYDLTWTEPRKVHKDCHFSFEGNRYSVPWQHGHAAVLVRRYPEERIEVERDGEVIATHRLRAGKGQMITLPDHVAGLWQRTLAKKPAAPPPGPQSLSTTPAGWAWPELEVELRDLAIYEQVAWAAAPSCPEVTP